MNLKSLPLPQATSQPLLEWLDRPEFTTLVLVLKSKQFTKEVEAAQSLIEASKGRGAEACKTKAEDDAAEAEKIGYAITLLQSIREAKALATVSAEP